MKKQLIAVLALAALLLCGTAMAMELPNPEAHLGKQFSATWEDDLSDGYHTWNWSHQLSRADCETLLDSYIADCEAAGLTVAKELSDGKGAYSVAFFDAEGTVYGCVVTTDTISVAGPAGTTLGSLEPEGDSDIDKWLEELMSGSATPTPTATPSETTALPVFNTPAPTHDVNDPLPLNTIRVKVGDGAPAIYDAVVTVIERGRLGNIISIFAENLDVRGDAIEDFAIQIPAQCYPGDVFTNFNILLFEYHVMQNGRWLYYYSTTDYSGNIPAQSKSTIKIDSIGDDGYTYIGRVEMVLESTFDSRKKDYSATADWPGRMNEYNTGHTIPLDIEFHVRAPGK